MEHGATMYCKETRLSCKMALLPSGTLSRSERLLTPLITYRRQENQRHFQAAKTTSTWSQLVHVRWKYCGTCRDSDYEWNCNWWCDRVCSSPAGDQCRSSDQWPQTPEWRHRILPVLQQTRPTRRQGSRTLFNHPSRCIGKWLLISCRTGIRSNIIVIRLYILATVKKINSQNMNCCRRL